ncbi:hypothetical protein BC938DRAFT_473292 [Jimgerdemannia flammicorona]|uniref:FCP1 homology domain-containing protein n=1 Tax=Jimgerdemannia flammicorona TaxID=994334 RepID=A0A433Q4A0_9FUNG|nr:hypothetical protein BC938DRAFT_473292 [Jimgerdemannia flammicorona]
MYAHPPFPLTPSQYVNNNLTLAAFHRARDRWNELHSSLTNPIWDKILPEPLPDPYQRPFTLVINLDETLIYSTWDVRMRYSGWMCWICLGVWMNVLWRAACCLSSSKPFSSITFTRSALIIPAFLAPRPNRKNTDGATPSAPA